MSRADPRAPAVCWARVDSAGADVSVPRGWLDGRPELRPYLAAAATLSAECAFLWSGPGGQLLSVQLTPRPSDSTRATSIEATVTPADAPHGLTPRELEVLTLIACGLDNTEIASRIGTARRTVATHVEHLLAKLDAPSRTAAAVIATTENLLTLPLPGDASALRHHLPVLRLEAAVRGEPAAPRRLWSTTRHHRKHDIVIGGVYPSFGPSVADGVVRRKATELAIAEINHQGGIAGHPLRHISTTTDITDPTALRGAIRTLVDQCPDAVTLGYTLASRDDFASLFADPAEHGCPVLHTATSASAQQLVLDEPTRFGNVFQVCAPEARYGAGFVRTLDDLSRSGRWTPPNRDIVVLDSVDTNLITFTAAAADLAERSSWRLTLEQVDFLKPEWASVLDRTVAIQPAAVMIATWLPDVLIDFLRRLRPLAPRTLVYAIYAPSVPEFVQKAGPLAEGLLWATVIGLYQDTLAGSNNLSG